MSNNLIEHHFAELFDLNEHETFHIGKKPFGGQNYPKSFLLRFTRKETLESD